MISEDSQTNGLPRNASNDWIQAIKARIRLRDPPSPSKPRVSGAVDCCPTLGYRQRLIGFVVCMALGMLLSLSSVSSVTSALLGNPIPFAVRYTLANVLSLLSYCFLVGPEHHCKGMLSYERRLSALAYVSSLAATLFSIFYLHSRILTLACLLVQCVAMMYYALSYLPFGQSILRRLLCGI